MVKPQSAKAKGRRLQQWFRDLLIQEKINIWKSYFQAQENSKDYEPIVVIKRNNHKPLLLVDAEHFIDLHSKNERK